MSLLGSGCLINDHRDGAGTPFPPTTTTVYDIAIGQPSSVEPGAQVGYGITALATGSYRFKWTGDASVNLTGYREFWGSAWTTGHFSNLIPGCANGGCPLEADQGDYVSNIITVTGGERIDWDTIASTGFDGFDVSTDTDPVYVDLFVDGNHLAGLVYLPLAPDGTIGSPSALPFAVAGM